MKKVSVCFIANHNYFFSRHYLESIGYERKKKEVDFVVKDAPIEYVNTIGEIVIELIVIDYTKDQRTTDFFAGIADNYSNIQSDNVAKSINNFLRIATGDLICVVPSGVSLQTNWLTEVIYYNSNVENCGIIGIPTKFSNVEFLPLPSRESDNYINVFLPKDNTIQGIYCFDKQVLGLIGALDESIDLSGNEMNQYCLRSAYSKFNNFYIPTQSSFSVNNEYVKGEKSDENMKSTLKEMASRRSFYIPL